MKLLRKVYDEILTRQCDLSEALDIMQEAINTGKVPTCKVITTNKTISISEIAKEVLRDYG